MKVHKPKYVKKAGCFVVTTIESKTISSRSGVKETSNQQQYWFSDEEDANNKYKELEEQNDKET